MSNKNGADYGPWNALVVFMVFCVVFCTVFPFQNSLDFFSLGNFLFDKVNLVSDFFYDGVREVLSIGDTFIYTDEIYCMRVRFLDNGVDDFGGSYYADFLVKADKPNSLWTMVYCNLPNVDCKGKVTTFYHSYLLTRDVDGGSQCTHFEVLQSTINPGLMAHGLDYFVDIENMDDMQIPKLTYKSYIYNIRSNPLETRYDYFVDSVFYG